jgi:hypothetical protein
MTATITEFLPQILAVLIDRAGGTIALTEADMRRIAEMKPDIQISTVDGFSGDALRIRYRDTATIEGEVV